MPEFLNRPVKEFDDIDSEDAGYIRVAKVTWGTLKKNIGTENENEVYLQSIIFDDRQTKFYKLSDIDTKET